MRHAKRVKLTPDLLVGTAVKDDTERSCSGSLNEEQRYCNIASTQSWCIQSTEKAIAEYLPPAPNQYPAVAL